jgi:hypothetical protein
MFAPSRFFSGSDILGGCAGLLSAARWCTAEGGLTSFQLPMVLNSTEKAHLKDMSTFARNGHLQALITGIFALMETRRGRLRPVILALKIGQQSG